MTVPAFLPREKPISRNAKPACMNITKQPATITQIELMPTESGSPLPAASNVSAMAAAGSTSRANSPNITARATGTSHGSSWSSAPRSLFAARRRVFRPVSKDPPRRFRHPVEAPRPRGRTGRCRFFDGWIRCRVVAATRLVLHSLRTRLRAQIRRTSHAHGTNPPAERHRRAVERQRRRPRRAATSPSPAPTSSARTSSASPSSASACPRTSSSSCRPRCDAARRSTRRSPTPSPRRCASGRWRRARRTTRTGSSR